MRPLEKVVIVSVATVLITIVFVVILSLMVYEEPQGYVAPCRTVGHLQIPESECGR